MTKGRSRRRRPGNDIWKIVIAALLILAALLFVIIRIRHTPKEPAPTASSSETKTPETSETQRPETPAETPAETETEP